MSHFAVSYQAIHEDIQGLKKGLELVRFEALKQPENAELEVKY